MTKVLPMLLFLDMDGVLNRNNLHHDADPVMVSRLNDFCAMTGCQIVINSAWNVLDLNTIRNILSRRGFRWEKRIIGQTAGSHGGGQLVRQWLTDHDRVGTPYIIFDDSTHDYDLMWGRLVKLHPRKGLTQAKLIYAYKVADMGTADEERARAAKHLIKELKRLTFKTPWLQSGERVRYIERMSSLLIHVLSVEDFELEAMLRRPDA